MSNTTADRPGWIIFVGGVVCLVAATSLGAYLASQEATRLSKVTLPPFLHHDAWGEQLKIDEARGHLQGVHALMWMVFGLGACMTLAGLRMMTQPGLEDKPLSPIGNVREVFENPD